MNPRFPILSITSLALRVLGALGAVLALLAIVFCLINLVIHHEEVTTQLQMENPALLITLLGPLSASISGLLISLAAIVVGETVGVLFAIELNTRQKQ